MNDFIPALLKEMESRTDYLGDAPVGTVYFGGGTPSLLDPEQLLSILRRLAQRFTVAPDAEITLEANPDDMTDAHRISAWRDAGINRLSIGIQSFFEEDLRWMNRAHSATQASASIDAARKAGFDNISIDLIYGGPTLPDDHWERNVARAVGLRIPHLSCYALTVEPRTALDKLIRTRKLSEVSPDDQARQLVLLMDWLNRAGYEHYEISNFALPGFHSWHNSSYWQGKPYLGLGPSAHSFNGHSREWNLANNALYLAAVSKDTLPVAEREELTPVQQFNEYIMIALRMSEGIDYQHIKKNWGELEMETVRRQANRYIQAELMETTGNYLKLTNAGKLLADKITADLFKSGLH